ncbi:MAG: flagellin [Holophagaceae bacterium]|nr:flagellin [Holophagaceae bacterium]
MGSQSILHNTSALTASRHLGITGMGLEKTIERLTTGLRINRAADDAAGLAISNRLGADIRIANQGRRNAHDGIAYLQVADGVLEEVNSLLTRALELTEQARTGTINSDNRKALDLEFQRIIAGIADIGINTKFNGQTIFVSTTVGVAVADFTRIGIATGMFATDVDLENTPVKATLFGKNLDGSDSTTIVGCNGPGIQYGYDTITTIAKADAIRDPLYAAIQSISMMRASIGANQQQLTSVAESLGIQGENFTKAYSQIRDANIADEVINLTKFQILNQSGTSALGQANQAAQAVLNLLR